MRVKALGLVWAFLVSVGASAYCGNVFPKSIQVGDIEVSRGDLFFKIPKDMAKRRRWVLDNFRPEMEDILERGHANVTALKNLEYVLIRSRKSGEVFLVALLIKKVKSEETEETATSVSSIFLLSGKAEFISFQSEFQGASFDRGTKTRWDTLGGLNYQKQGYLFDVESVSSMDSLRRSEGERIALRIETKNDRYAETMEQFQLMPARETEIQELYND